MFMCQRNPTLTEYSTQVVSCDRVDDTNPIKKQLETAPSNGVSNTLSGTGTNSHQDSYDYYEVVLDDTILFPEGGGQPDDHGSINEYEVVRVIRDGSRALHYLQVHRNTGRNLGSNIFEKGQSVSIKLNWERRFDHMQQHSGQHLISARADQLFQFNTTSWWLGSQESTSFIEFDTKEMTNDQMRILEEDVNEKIRAAVPVTVDVVSLDDPKLKTARGRNLPSDIKDKIRIVTIAGVEGNVCCGTHVSSLSQLQAIKLLSVEKKKGKCLLHFVAGNRVLKKLGEMFQREMSLTSIFSCPPPELVPAAEKVQLALKVSKKSGENLRKDLAKLDAKNLLSGANSQKFLHYHKDNVDLDFGTALLRELGVTKDIIILVTLKLEGNSGNLLLRGAENVLDSDKLLELGNLLCSVLDGKGTLRGNLFQAKVSKIGGVTKAVKAAKEFLTLCESPKKDN